MFKRRALRNNITCFLRVFMSERVERRGGRAGQVRDRDAAASGGRSPRGGAQEDLLDGDDAGEYTEYSSPERASRRSLSDDRAARVDRLERNLRPSARQVITLISFTSIRINSISALKGPFRDARQAVRSLDA